MLLMILISANDAPRAGKYVFIAVIFIAVLIDAVRISGTGSGMT